MAHKEIVVGKNPFLVWQGDLVGGEVIFAVRLSHSSEAIHHCAFPGKTNYALYRHINVDNQYLCPAANATHFTHPFLIIMSFHRYTIQWSVSYAFTFLSVKIIYLNMLEKGIIHSKMKTFLFAHIHLIPDLYVFLFCRTKHWLFNFFIWTFLKIAEGRFIYRFWLTRW